MFLHHNFVLQWLYIGIFAFAILKSLRRQHTNKKRKHIVLKGSFFQFLKGVFFVLNQKLRIIVAATRCIRVTTKWSTSKLRKKHLYWFVIRIKRPSYSPIVLSRIPPGLRGQICIMLQGPSRLQWRNCEFSVGVAKCWNWLPVLVVMPPSVPVPKKQFFYSWRRILLNPFLSSWGGKYTTWWV